MYLKCLFVVYCVLLGDLQNMGTDGAMNMYIYFLVIVQVSVRALPENGGTQELVLSVPALELTWTTSSGRWLIVSALATQVWCRDDDTIPVAHWVMYMYAMLLLQTLTQLVFSAGIVKDDNSIGNVTRWLAPCYWISVLSHCFPTSDVILPTYISHLLISYTLHSPLSLIHYLLQCFPPPPPSFRFSFLRESSGAVSTVLYPPSESPSVLAFKKSLAKLLSTDAAFSERGEDGSNSVFTWEWVEGDGVREGGGGGREKSVRKVMSLDETGAIVQIKVDENISSPERDRRTGISVWSALLSLKSVHMHACLLWSVCNSWSSIHTVLHRVCTKSEKYTYMYIDLLPVPLHIITICEFGYNTHSELCTCTHMHYIGKLA